MSITRLQQARQMYAMGQRVAKTMDGSRPGYRGDRGYQGSSGSSGPAGGASSGGSYGGNTGGGNTNTGGGNGGPPQHSPHSNTGYTGPTSYGPPAPVDRSAVNQFSQYGRNVMNQNLKGPSLGQKIGQGIGDLTTGIVDFYKQGGMLGMLARGLGSLFPSIPSTGNVGPAGIKTDGTYGTVEDAERASRRNEPILELGGENKYIPPLYTQESFEDTDGDGIISLQDIVLRFQGADRTLNPEAAGFQDTDELREAIMEKVKNLYTT
mgnify:CR=1 FL=1